MIKSYSRSEIKVIDFGSSCYIHDHLSSYVQSRSYRAPEVIIGCSYDYKIDIWAAGLIFAEMFFQKYPFWKPEEDIVILENIYNMVGSTKFSNYLKKIGSPSTFEFMKNPSKGQNFESYFEREANDEIMNNLEDKKNGIDLIKKMLDIDPNSRYSAEECLKHPFFQSIKK